MKKLLLPAVLGLVALLVVPVMVARLHRPEPRHFERVALGETLHQEVRFRNAAAGLDLAGLLFVPAGDGPFPAAVIIHGSGPSRRDNGWYLTLAEYLRRNGIVVLLPDKRGSEESQGDWQTASFVDLATDTEAAIDYLRTQGRVGLSRIGVVGLSQGGHIAPLLADRAAGKVDFVVNVVGGAVPMHELLLYEETHNLRELGVLPGLADALAYPASWSIIHIRQRAFWKAVGNFDPLPCWRRIAVPALVLYGEEDTNVPTRRSAERLRSLENPDIEVRVYAGSGHALESPPGAGDSLFRPEALRDIRDFILDSAR